ncbi:hypothetical protein ACFY9A_38440 [Streptomyces rubradiris]|uniref:hypothetical protein n=1 Tax=Streptomyces rubradiris TaxID=285531 RepID=UPI0036E3A789
MRRTPSSALASLALAYTSKSPAISRPLLLAFARSVLAHPDATEPPAVDDGSPLVCYSERHLAEDEQSPITAGMAISPDLGWRPTRYVADKEWFDETFPVELGRPAPAPAASSGAGTRASAVQSGPADGSTSHGKAPPDPREQLATLRRELPARVELVAASYQHTVDSAHTLMTDFEEARRLRAQLGEESLPAEQRIE